MTLPLATAPIQPNAPMDKLGIAKLTDANSSARTATESTLGLMPAKKYSLVSVMTSSLSGTRPLYSARYALKTHLSGTKQNINVSLARKSYPSTTTPCSSASKRYVTLALNGIKSNLNALLSQATAPKTKFTLSKMRPVSRNAKPTILTSLRTTPASVSLKDHCSTELPENAKTLSAT